MKENKEENFSQSEEPKKEIEENKEYSESPVKSENQEKGRKLEEIFFENKKENINTSQKTVYQKISKRETILKEKKCESFNSMISFISFTMFVFECWFSIKCLYNHGFLFTIEKSINADYIFYFPLHIHTIYLYCILFFLSFIATFTFILFIKKISYDKDQIFIDYFFNSQLKYHFLPLLFNSLLFILAELVYYKREYIKIFYFIGMFIDIVSIISSIFIYNFNEFREEDLFINYLFKKGFLSTFFFFNFYYLFYVIIQIICSFHRELHFMKFLGWIGQIFVGSSSIAIAHILNNIICPFFFLLIFIGVLYFHYSIPKEYRDYIELGSAEVIINIVLIILLLLQMFHIYYKKKKLKILMK